MDLEATLSAWRLPQPDLVDARSPALGQSQETNVADSVGQWLSVTAYAAIA